MGRRRWSLVPCTSGLLDHHELPSLRDLREAARVVDSPWMHPVTVDGLRGELRHGHDGEPPVCFLGRLDPDGPVVVEGLMHLSEWDNRDLAWLDVTVHPDHRRRGLGTAMWSHLVEQAGEAARPRIGASAWKDSAGGAFLEELGLSARAVGVLSRQHLDELDLDEVRRLRNQAARHAAAYDVLLVDGPTPPGRFEELAALAASINDAPMDDLDYEDEVYDAVRLQHFEVANEARDRDLHRAVAVERTTGAWVGHTVLVTERGTPEVGHQLDTAVMRQHRGHRLGLLLKATLLLHLAGTRPALRTVDTWNAASNTHMVEVNSVLGYRPLAEQVDFQQVRATDAADRPRR